MADVVILFPLEREARPFRKLCPTVPVELTGVGVERAKQCVESLLNRMTPRLIILAGFGGALTATAKVGDVVIAKDVCDEAGTVIACQAHEKATGRVLTVNRMIATSIEKMKLGATHSAAVCDMESVAVASICQGKGVPYLAVRAISDDATRSLPPEIDAIIQNGVVSKWRAFKAIIRRPSILRTFWSLLRDTQAASERLSLTLREILAEGQ